MQGRRTVALLAWIVLACLDVADPIVTPLVHHDRAATVLDEWTRGLTGNDATLMAFVFRFISVILIGMNLGPV